MGHFLSCKSVRSSTRITEPDLKSIPIHHKCRNCGQPCEPSKNSDRCVNAKVPRTGTKDQPEIIRAAVPNDKVRWSTPFDYHPVDFTSEKIRKSTQEYVDRDPRFDSTTEIPWNTDDTFCDRRSYHGIYQIISKLPQNPCGRTGITGRGYLGHFGPNHAADPIVTRWKTDENGRKVLHPKTKRPILQFVCICRKDTKQFALPGGMVDRKEKVSDTLQREFHEEALNYSETDKSDKESLLKKIEDFFQNGGTKIYCGYVDDPRNTDNSWLETTVYNFHDEHNQHLGLVNVEAGDDADSAFWQDLDSQLYLYANHGDFLKRVAELHKAHW